MVNEQRVYNSFYAAVADVVEMIKDGWEVDLEKEIPTLVAYSYEVTFSHEGTPPVKRTRAEILADARAAKAAKKGAE